MRQNIPPRNAVGVLLLVLLAFLASTATPVAAKDQSALASARLFQNHPPERDPTGRSKKLAHAMTIHQQRKPSVWDNDLAATRDLPMLVKLQTVQEIVNKRIEYQDDPGNIWESPFEAYRNGGDCEDYAIAKMLLLKEGGVPEENLRLITLAPIHTRQVYHVILVAKWQDHIYVLDSPNRPGSKKVPRLEEYVDAARPVVWAGWLGGYTSTSQPLGNVPLAKVDIPSVDSPVSGLGRMPSYRQYPAKEKLVRIAADFLIIHPWEPPLTPEEINRLRILRRYFNDPTPENAQTLSPFEVRKLTELRNIGGDFSRESLFSGKKRNLR